MNDRADGAGPGAEAGDPLAGQAARAVAIRLMTGVSSDGAMLSEVVDGAAQALEPAEKARAQRLALGALRWSDRSDRMLGRFLGHKPVDAVLNILRLGTYEICAHGEAPHGVVNTLVSVAKADSVTRRSAGLINAVLRKIASLGEVAWADLPLPMLPKKIRAPLVKQYGRDVVVAMEAAHLEPAPLDLTPRDGDAAALARMVGGAVLPTGSVRLRDAGQVTALPGYTDGAWWVQDAAAALPARALHAAPGERVLDLCAAPGGKTMQLAATGALVTALDISERRMARVRDNLRRGRLSADLVVADAMQWVPAELFDAVLLDAPCSATGTIRRHPDLPHAKRTSTFDDLVDMQGRLIARAVRMLRPGGRLVFCTCSLLDKEGAGQVRDAMAADPRLVVDRGALARLPGLDEGWFDDVGGLRLRPDFWPDAGHLDGFYIAALQRLA